MVHNDVGWFVGACIVSVAPQTGQWMSRIFLTNLKTTILVSSDSLNSKVFISDKEFNLRECLSYKVLGWDNNFTMYFFLWSLAHHQHLQFSLIQYCLQHLQHMTFWMKLNRSLSVFFFFWGGGIFCLLPFVNYLEIRLLICGWKGFRGRITIVMVTTRKELLL